MSEMNDPVPEKRQGPSARGRKKRALRPAKAYVDGILAGDRVLLGQAITLVESQLERHQAIARAIIDGCLPHANQSVRLGITGAPGVGKSTFIEALGTQWLEAGHQLAVLAIDPSSQLSKGSILGDKTRMGHLSTDQRAFIRPSPAGSTLGGVARHTRETILLCEAAGYNRIIVETVGVGQSETAVHSMVDYFLLLLLPGAGDELQGIKRGVVEMADGLAINKADGERAPLAKQAKKEYARALHLFPLKESGLTVDIHLCSALEKTGVKAIWQSIQQHIEQTTESGYFQDRRQNQALYWLNESIGSSLKDLLYRDEKVQQLRPEIEKAVLEGRMSPFEGANRLLNCFSKS